MRTRDLEKFKKQLLQMRERLLREWSAFEKNQMSQNFKENLGQVSSFTTHPADMGSVTDEQENAFILAGHGRELLEAIDRAIERIEDGSFGKCGNCGKIIDKDRLNAVPYVDFCIDCQEEIDSREEE